MAMLNDQMVYFFDICLGNIVPMAQLVGDEDAFSVPAMLMWAPGNSQQLRSIHNTTGVHPNLGVPAVCPLHQCWHNNFRPLNDFPLPEWLVWSIKNTSVAEQITNMDTYGWFMLILDKYGADSSYSAS